MEGYETSSGAGRGGSGEMDRQTWEELVVGMKGVRLEVKRQRLVDLYGEVYDSVLDDDKGEGEEDEADETDEADVEEQGMGTETGKGKNIMRKEFEDEEGDTSIEDPRKRRRTKCQ